MLCDGSTVPARYLEGKEKKEEKSSKEENLCDDSSLCDTVVHAVVNAPLLPPRLVMLTRFRASGYGS